MAVASAARAKRPTGPRTDPVVRSGTGPRLKNRDPSLHYVLASPHDPDTGLQSYLERGYEPVLEGSGARLAGGRSKESLQTYRDLVLVAAPLSMAQDEGQAARLRAEALWRRLRAKKGVDDFSRTRVRGESGDDVVSVVEGDAERAED